MLTNFALETPAVSEELVRKIVVSTMPPSTPSNSKPFAKKPTLTEEFDRWTNTE
jgi:hypothetical protein